MQNVWWVDKVHYGVRENSECTLCLILCINYELFQQLSAIMTVANCFVDLIDIQGSSVLVCFEDGWDATAQVSVQCGFVSHSITRRFCCAENYNERQKC